MSEEKTVQNATPTETESEEAKKNENLYGNVYDNLVKNFFSLVFVFADFLCNYADPDFVSEIEADKIFAAPTHYISPKGHEQIIDLVFKVPLKNSATPLLAVIVFEHQNDSLWDIPRKLIKYITAVWETELKNNEPLSVPYFIVLRTGKKPLVGLPPDMCDRFPKGKDGKRLGMKISVEYKGVPLK